LPGGTGDAIIPRVTGASHVDSQPAARRWTTSLAEWAIPEDILEAAPSSPWGFDPATFAAAADDALARTVPSPSTAAALAGLPPDGTVMDVGAGGGAGSLPLAARASRLVAVDASPDLLEEFAIRATRLRVAHDTVEGVWPQIAPVVPVVDVVVCHNVLYNVADLEPFAAALDAHARHRVVVELTQQHPLRWMAPYWEALHGLQRPDRPTADDAVAALREAGYAVTQQQWQRPFTPIRPDDPGAFERFARRLCVGPARHGELRDLLLAHPPPTERAVATLWWEPASRTATG
jgi:SAM-dependent methyltransferase